MNPDKLQAPLPPDIAALPPEERLRWSVENLKQLRIEAGRLQAQQAELRSLLPLLAAVQERRRSQAPAAVVAPSPPPPAPPPALPPVVPLTPPPALTAAPFATPTLAPFSAPTLAPFGISPPPSKPGVLNWVLLGGLAFASLMVVFLLANLLWSSSGSIKPPVAPSSGAGTAEEANLDTLLRRTLVYKGWIVAKTGDTRVPISIEFMPALSTDQRVAMLRNDGAWADARRFAAEPLESKGASLVYQLTTTPSDRVPLGGPLLDNTDGWTLRVAITREQFTGESESYRYELTRVHTRDVEAFIAEQGRPFREFCAWLASNPSFGGLLVEKSTQQQIAVTLAFGQMAEGGTEVTALLSSKETPRYGRSFRGSLIASKYRTGGVDLPLMLESTGDPSWSNPELPLLGTSDAAVLRLQREGSQLTGGNERFLLKLRPIR